MKPTPLPYRHKLTPNNVFCNNIKVAHDCLHYNTCAKLYHLFIMLDVNIACTYVFVFPTAEESFPDRRGKLSSAVGKGEGKGGDGNGSASCYDTKLRIPLDYSPLSDRHCTQRR